MTLYYEDDLVRLYHGDCRDVLQWLEADVLVTDPPYGIGWKRGSGAGPSDRGHAGIANDADTSERDYALRLWGAKPGIVFGSFDAPAPARRKQTLVWRKWTNSGVVGSVTGWRRDVEPIYLTGDWPVIKAARSSLLTASGGTGNIHAPQRKYDHPHAKPLDVVCPLIQGCPPGVITDPFAGSGSTLVAARDMGRKAIGVELEERHCETAARRLSQQPLDIFGEGA